jgi:UDPglucose--hexose-1-phosphate uridylyltransferase
VQLQEVFWAYRQRLVELKRDPRLKFAIIFKNLGAAAGASLEHAHSQLIVTPMVPHNAREELLGAEASHRRTGQCVYCAMIRQELAAGVRIVADLPGFVAFCPFASRVPLETWILPKEHASHYEEIEGSDLRKLAAALKQTLARIESVLDQPAYNYLIHTAPFDTRGLAHYHWHIEVIPSLTKMAGFEWGSGFYINPVTPEEAAARLRQAGV